MSVAWTITGGAYVNEPMKNLGLSQLRRSLLNQGKDTCSFVQDGALFDGTPLFAKGSTVTIKRAGVKYFVGTVLKTPRRASGRAESMAYQLVGPWYYLEQTVFQQNWKIPVTPTNPASTLTNEKRSSVILNLKEDGTTLTTRQQIKESFDYAVACGAPIAIADTDFPALNVPWEEGKDMTCAEVIRRQMRLAPDGSLWWDYTAATPTLHCAQRAGATAKTYAVDGTEPRVTEIDLDSLEELQVPVVALKFESVNQQDETSWTQTTTQKYPALASESQIGALIMTIPLSGGVVNYQRQKVKTRALAAANDLPWWKKRLDWLNDASITGITITGETDVDDNTGAALGGGFVNELLDGAVPPWLSAYATTVTANAFVDYTLTNSDGAITVVRKKPISARYVATTSRIQSASPTVFKEYKQLVTWIAGESVPAGLAQALYDALSVLQYEGSLVLTETDVAADVRPGHVLNLTGGLAAWATMAAQIQRIDEDVDPGITRITVGPAKHLGPADMIELLRPNRSRLKAISQPTRTTGQARADAVTDGSTSTPRNSGSGAAGAFKKLYIVDSADTTKQMQLDASALATGEVVALRTVKVWDDVANTCKTMKVLGTVPV